MPELPEVETIRQDLRKKILRKKISDVLVRRKSMVNGNARNFIKILIGSYFIDIDRIGKLLIFDLKQKEKFMLLHLKMTGQLVYCEKDKCFPGGHPYPAVEKLPNKYSHIIFKFRDGSKLFFNDQRTFGYAQIVNKKERNLIAEHFGIEPLTKNFTLKNFQNALEGRKKNIKAVLMDQKLIAGIGNIYADEILYDAKVRPSRKANKLTKKEIIKIFKSTNKILKKAIEKRGTTFSDYLDANGRKGNYVKYLKAYDQEGKVCGRCHKSKIVKIKIGGRGTRYCPRCQK